MNLLFAYHCEKRNIRYRIDIYIFFLLARSVVVVMLLIQSENDSNASVIAYDEQKLKTTN